MIALPAITAADIDPDASKGAMGDEEMDTNALKRLDSSPAFTGDIVTAIFDAAMTQIPNGTGGVDVAESIFDLVASFATVPATRRILGHVLTHLQLTVPESPEAIICEVRLHTFGIDALSAEFPAALGSSLATIKKGMAGLSEVGLSEVQQARLAEKTVLVLLPFLKHRDEVDEGVKKVLEGSVRRYLALATSKCCTSGGKTVDRGEMLRSKLRDQGKLGELEILEGFTDDMDLG